MRSIYAGGRSIKTTSIHYQWVEDLIYYDGPLLSYVRGNSQQDYFYLWVDHDDQLNRWMAIPVTRDMIRGYKDRTLSLHSIVQQVDLVLFLDIDDALKVKRAFELSSSMIPAELIPSTESYFDPSYCPTGNDVLQDSTDYYLGLDRRWFFEDVRVVERRYKQTYSFIYTFLNLGRTSVAEKMTQVFRDYNWYGGASRVHFFNDLDKNVPSMHEPRLEAFHYASPGFIKLELWEQAAEKLGDLSSKVALRADRIVDLVANINLFLRDRDLKSQGDQAILSPESKSELFSMADELCGLLELLEFSDSLKKLVSNNPIKYAKILLAFHTRLSELLTFVERGMLKLKVEEKDYAYHNIP